MLPAMGWGRTKLAAGWLAIAIAVMLAGPGSAQALSLRYAVTMTNVGPGAQGGSAAFCPEDRHVTGGGLLSGATYDETTIADSFPLDSPDSGSKPDDGWGATIDNQSAGSRGVTIYAICAKQMPKYRSKSFDTDLPAGIVKCPRGTAPAGGGLTTQGTYAENAYALTSIPQDGDDAGTRPDSWLASAETPGNLELPATAFVVCVEGISLAYKDTTFAVAGMTQAFGDRPCKPEEKVIGIGAATSSGSMAINSMFPTDTGDSDNKPDDNVRAFVDNYVGFQRDPFVHAVCAK